MRKQKERERLSQTCYRRKREMKKVAKVLSAVLVLGMMLTGCTSEEKKEDEKVLTIATSAPYEPYEMVNADGELEGFDIDFGNAVAEELGYTVEWKNLDFDAALLEVQSGVTDMMIAGVSPTEERKEAVDFSDVYFAGEAANVVVTLKDKGYEDADDLKGLSAGVQNATLQHQTVESIADEYDLTVEVRKQYADIVLEIMNGSIGFMVCEEAVAKNFVETYPELVSFPLGVGEESAGNAVAFEKGSDLVEDVNAAIKKLQDNGTIDELVEKWFN